MIKCICLTTKQIYYTNPRYKDVLRQYKNSHLSILLSLLNQTSSLIYKDIYSIVIYLLAYWSSQSSALITWELISETLYWSTKAAFSAKLDK